MPPTTNDDSGPQLLERKSRSRFLTESHLTVAARILGINRSTLDRKLERYEIRQPPSE